ncbi:eukaryotic translation initiation factor 4 gamma 1-like [Brachionichthys hirsutus]|uniref:eukaryotic translation initiation factor 4 gamma 1-like n=1 Tax=Brachionichthys hirsutus TaxID=412623 RepID=UPI003604502A
MDRLTTPLRPAEPSQLRKNGNQGVTPSTLHRSTMPLRPAEPSQLRKNAWKPSAKASTLSRTEDVEQLKTKELLKNVCGILNKVKPQTCQQLVNQLKELTIDTEERLRGVADLIFEKAISKPRFSRVYATMCCCLMDLKVSSPDKPGMCVNFRTLLLRQCQKEFEKIQQKPKLEAAKAEDGDCSGNKFLRRSLGNVALIGELFTLKILPAIIIHECVQKLLQNHHDPVSLECLCKLLYLTGKALDVESAKHQMDQYFTRIYNVIQERKTSTRVDFMLQDLMDRKMANWIPRKYRGPKPIEQIHKDTAMEDTREHVKVQQQPRDRTTGTWNPHTPAVNSSPTPPPLPSKSTLNAEEVEKTSDVINDEYRHIEDVEEVEKTSDVINDEYRHVEDVEEVEKTSDVINDEYRHIEDVEEASERVGECNSASTPPPSGNSLIALNEVPTGEQLDRLLRDNADSEQIISWIEANFEEAQITSNEFVRLVMTSVCQSVICHNPFRVDGKQMSLWANLLKKYLNDEQKELQALYAIQAVVARMDHPGKLLRMIFDSLFDRDVIKVGAFYKWESSEEPKEQTGKDAALKSVKAFFVWLHDADL